MKLWTLDGANLDRQRVTQFNAIGLPAATTAGCGAAYTQVVNGWGLVTSETSPELGTITYTYDGGGLLTGINANGRVTTITRDANGNPTVIDPPGDVVITQEFNARNALTKRTETLDNGQVRVEEFEYDANLNLTQHRLVGGRTTTFVYDDDNRLTEIQNPDGVTRAFTYNANGQVVADSSGGSTLTRTYDLGGRLTGIGGNGLPGFAIDYDGGETRPVAIRQGAATVYGFTYDSAKRLTAVADTTAALGGALTWEVAPDEAGYGWTRTLKDAAGTALFTLTRPINDIDALTATRLTPAGVGDLDAGYTLQDNVRPATLTRPGGLPGTEWAYNGAKEITELDHGDVSVGLTRDADTGWIMGRDQTWPGLAASDTFTRNKAGWLTGESRPGWNATYGYRQDGARTGYTLNGRHSEFVVSGGGAVREVRNALLGARLAAPYEGPVYTVGTHGDYATVEAAVRAVFADCGAAAFDKAAVVCLLEAPAAAITVRETGAAASDFDDGTGGGWSVTEAGGGSVDADQAAVRLGDAGCAPLCSAGDAGQAYLTHAASSIDGKVGESFHFQLSSQDMDNAADSGVLCRVRSATQTLVEVRLVYAGGVPALQVQYLATAGMQTGGTTGAVSTGTWYDVAFVYKADKAGGDPDGRFRCWVDGTQLCDVDGLETPAGASAAAVDLGLVTVSNCSLGVVIDNAGIAGLRPTATFPLIVRSAIGAPVTLAHTVTVRDQGFVRLQGVYINPAGTSPAVLFDNVDGPSLASCAVRAPVRFDACTGAKIVGNTFDASAGTAMLELADSATAALLRDNLFLNDGTIAGWTATGTAPDNDYNAYWPASISPAEAHGVNADPLLIAGTVYTNAAGSSIVSTGTPVAGFTADLDGHWRHLTAPCIGATEFQFDTATFDAAGRMATRAVAGRECQYAYDAYGRLIAFTDTENPANDTTYSYDAFGRRVTKTTGSCTTRFVYDLPQNGGDDVVAELIDEDGDGTVDRKRVYWVLPDIDQRLGFVDYASNGTATTYYYLTDQVGSVMAVLDAGGSVVNRYDYDAFGNLRRGTSFEGVENRYRFHGREWDAERGEYYYRYRTYVPEWGAFSGPDPDTRPFEAEGAGNYLLCANDPVGKTDPEGLAANPYEWNWHHLLATDVFGEKGYIKKAGMRLAKGVDIGAEKWGWMLQAGEHTFEGGVHPSGWNEALTEEVKEFRRQGVKVLTESHLEEIADRMKRAYGLIDEAGKPVKGMPAIMDYGTWSSPVNRAGVLAKRYLSGVPRALSTAQKGLVVFGIVGMGATTAEALDAAVPKYREAIETALETGDRAAVFEVIRDMGIESSLQSNDIAPFYATWGYATLKETPDQTLQQVLDKQGELERKKYGRTLRWYERVWQGAK